MQLRKSWGLNVSPHRARSTKSCAHIVTAKRSPSARQAPERGVDSMRRAEIAQLAERRPVSLAGALDGASDCVPGDEGENDGMPPDGCVLPVLRNEVQQSGRGRGLPVLNARRVHLGRPAGRHVPGRASLHHAAMIRNNVPIR